MNEDHDLMLDPDDAAQLLAVTPVTLEGWRRRNVGPSWIKLGAKLVRYRRRELLQWLKSCERHGSSTDAAPLSRAG